MRTSKLRAFFILQLCFHYANYSIHKFHWKSFWGNAHRTWCSEELARWARRILKLFDTKLRVFNPHHVEPKAGVPTMIMSNHAGILNPAAALTLFPKHPVRIVTLTLFNRLPIIGKVLRSAEFAFVSNHKKNRKKVIQDLARIIRLMKSGIVMWVAPEGKSMGDGKLCPFQKGGFVAAIKAGATIIPMGVQGKPVFEKELKPYHLFTGGVTCGPAWIKQTVNIHIGQPIDASQYSLKNLDELRARVFGVIQGFVE